MLARLLEDAEVQYALIGGHAVNAWLEPRFTADIDVTIEAGVAQYRRLTKILQRAGFSIEFTEGADQASGPDFVRFTSPDPVAVVEFQSAKTKLQNSVIRRARIQKGALRVATPEDLIVLKLIANRAKDQIDLVGLCALPDLDWDYVERWAREWEVTALLSQFKSPSGV